MFVEYIRPKRCQCCNITNKICNNRQHKFYIYKMRRVCITHFKILFKNVTIIIQKNYRGYISRKKLNYFYKRLPHDIQYKIKYFINEELYLKKFNNNLRLVVNQKIKKFIIIYFNLLNQKNIGYPISQLEEHLLNKNYIIESYRLFTKYFPLFIKPILINMRTLWYKIFKYHSNIHDYYVNNNLDNNHEVLSTLLNIEDKIKYYITTSPYYLKKLF